MSTQKSKYDIMMDFFNMPGDQRVRLYLHLLRTCYDEGKPLALRNDMEQLKNKYYEGGATDDDNTSVEWDDFRSDLEQQLSVNDSNLSDNVTLNFIKANGGIAQRGSEKHFIQEVIKSHVNVSSYDHTTKSDIDITDEVHRWSTALIYNMMPRKLNIVFHHVGHGFANTGVKNFTYKLTKYVLHKLLEQAAQQPLLGNDSFWTNDQQNESYFRSVNNSNVLFTVDKNGNRIDVSRGSAVYNSLKDDACIGTKVKQDRTNTCTNYITKCINGTDDDIVKCREFMLSTDFWDVVPKEVNEMLPTIAEDTLKSFGFKIVVDDNLKKFESVGEWSKELGKSSISPADIETIRKNTKLMTYLSMLVDKVNSNPAILNKNYISKNSVDLNDHGTRFSSWNLTARGLRPRVMFKKGDNLSQINILRHSGLLVSNLLNLRSIVNNRIAFVPGSGLVVGGVPVGVNSPLFVGVGQYGGAAVVVPSFQYYPSSPSAVPNDEGLREQYSLLKNLFYSVEKQLESKGKNFDGNTKQYIETYLENFKNTESKLIKAIRYADKYLDLLDIYQNNDPENVLNMEHLKKFVDAREQYFDKTINKQNTLLNAIQTIINKIDDALDSTKP
jgi:hypothetical protein